jgi:hypothetical protein
MARPQQCNILAAESCVADLEIGFKKLELVNFMIQWILHGS